MGRGAGESSVFVGEGAETFYDTQKYQYGVREKWGYCSYDPNTDSGHHIYPKIPDGGLFIKPWEYVGNLNFVCLPYQKSHSICPVISRC